MTNRIPRIDPDGDDKIDTSQIANDAVGSRELDTSDTPADGDVPSWNNSLGQFEFVPRVSGSSGTLTADATVGSSGGYNSIQGAMDDLAANSGSASGQVSGVIDILNDYSPTSESGTLDVINPFIFQTHGKGTDARIEWGSAQGNIPMFRLDISGEIGGGNPRYYPVFKDLFVNGGSVVFDMDWSVGLITERCTFNNQDDGLVDMSGANFSGWQRHLFTHVTNYTNVGWDFTGADIEPNATWCFGCFSDRGGDGSPKPWINATPGTGYGVKPSGYGFRWVGGDVERNAGPGFSFKSGNPGDFFIDGVYMESNGAAPENADHACHVHIDDSLTNTIILDGITSAPGGDQPNDDYIILSGQNKVIRDPKGQSLRSWGSSDPAVPKVRIEGGRFIELDFDNTKVEVKKNGGDNIIENGQSTNNGDPRNTGAWQNVAYRGVEVEDETNPGDFYRYSEAAGDWVPA